MKGTVFVNNVRMREKAQDRAGSRPSSRQTAAGDYKRRVKPRNVNSAVSASPNSINKNLRKINSRYVAVPRVREAAPARVSARYRVRAKQTALVTEKAKSKRPFPIVAITACLLVTAVFMYIISLYIKLDDYNSEISAVKSEISQLREDATVLQVGIETKFNLDMVEKAAVEEYGMVSADTLQKTYVSVTAEDVGEVITPSGKKNSLGSLFSGIGSALNLR